MNIEKLKSKLLGIKRPYGVEIGVCLGNDSSTILKGVKKSRLAIIDMFVEHAESDNDIHANYTIIRNRVEQFGTRAMIIRLDSKTAADKYRNGTFDFIYFNTGTLYNNIRDDIMSWYLKVKTGGYMCGNGYTRYPLVKSAIDDLFCGTADINNDFWISEL